MCRAFTRSRTTASTAASPARELSPIAPPVSTVTAFTFRPSASNSGDHPVQVVLTLAVLPIEPGKRLEQRASLEGEQHDRDLADRADLRRGVELLDDLDQSRARAHHPAVAAGVVEHRRGDRGGRLRPAMRGDQALHVGAGDGVVVATHDEHVVSAADGSFGHLHRVAGAELPGLFDEDRLGRDAPARPPRHARRRPRGPPRRSPSSDWLRVRPAPRARAPAARRSSAAPWGSRTSIACPCPRRAPPGPGSESSVSWSGPTVVVQGRRVEGLRRRAVMVPHRRGDCVVPGGGIEPPFQAPKARVLPLDDPGSQCGRAISIIPRRATVRSSGATRPPRR